MFEWINRNKNNNMNLEKRYADFFFLHANVKSAVDSKWSANTFKNAIIVFLETKLPLSINKDRTLCTSSDLMLSNFWYKEFYRGFS